MRRITIAFIRCMPYSTLMLCAVQLGAYFVLDFSVWQVDPVGVRAAWRNLTVSRELATLLTASFVHINSQHLLSVTLSLLFFSSLLEAMLLTRKEPASRMESRLMPWFLFVGSGLFTAIVEVLCNSEGGGASAGVHGILGATLVLSGVQFIREVTKIEEGNSEIFPMLIFIALLASLSGFDNLRAHWTGFLAGLLLGIAWIVMSSAKTRVQKAFMQPATSRALKNLTSGGNFPF